MPGRAVVSLEDALERAGWSWEALESAAEQIVLFGSRAAGLGTGQSDWDLLCVGQGRSRHRDEIDLVWIRPEEVSSPEWLGSELASHVAAFGRWLHGSGTWKSRAFVSPRAVERKRRHLQTRVAALRESWASLSLAARRKHLTRLRRDLQRLDVMLEGRPVPPSPILDEAWSSHADHAQEFGRLLRQANLDDTAFGDNLP